MGGVEEGKGLGKNLPGVDFSRNWFPSSAMISLTRTSRSLRVAM